MIKWLKKLCILWLIGLPILLGNFSNAFTWGIVNNFYNSAYDSSIQLAVLPWGVVVSDNWEFNKNVFAPIYDFLFFWSPDSNPTIITPSYYDSHYWWELLYYYFCDPITNNFSNLSNCSSPESINFSYMWSFLSSLSSTDRFVYELRQWSNVMYWFDLCFSSSSESKSMCFWIQASSYNGWHDLFQSDRNNMYWYDQSKFPFSWSANNVLTYNLWTIPSLFIWNPPYTFTNPSFPISSWSVMSWIVYDSINRNDIINYFEDKFNFDEYMCYVWTTDLDSLYEDRIPYDQWSWYTIFDTFSKLYNKTTFDLSDISSFYWVWIDNFDNWFQWWDHSVIYNYNELPTYWSNLTNPFLNNKAVYFFIWSSFRTYWYNRYNYDSHQIWEALLYYCYNKLDNYSNDWSTYNINENVWSHFNLDILNNKRHQNSSYYSWESEIVAQSREWTPVEYFSSWSNYTNARDFFNANFNKFKEVLRPLSPWDLGFWYVPWYIILFMLALILFRFLWH